MSARHLICVCFPLFACLHGLGQKNAKVVADLRTRQPIDYVYVSSPDNKGISLLGTKDGRIILVANEKIRSWTFYKMGYTRRTVLASELAKQDTVFLSEYLFRLEDVTITSRLIDTVVMDKRFYVNDYLLLPNNDLLLITSKINIRGFEVAYYKRNRGITQVKKIRDETGEHFFTDCFKNAHLVTDRFSRQIFFDSDSSFDFLSRYSKAKFDSTLAFCVLKLDSQVIVKQIPPQLMVKGGFLQNSSVVNYMKVSKRERKLFRSVFYNKEMMEMLNFEMADAEMLVRNAVLFGARPPSEAAMANQHELFFTRIAAPIYAPVFLKNDTVVLFNFQEKTIEFLNKNGGVLQQVHLNENSFFSIHDLEVICDGPRQKFYLRSKRTDRSSLQLINIYSGDLGNEIRLEKVFAKNIQVSNGRIYYLVKEKGWDDTCYLYQQN